MIRNDFVSNSSSSSYIVVIPKNDIENFIIKICDNCVDKKEEPNIYKDNENTLRYAIDNFRLLYLGGVFMTQYCGIILSNNDIKFKNSVDDKEFEILKNNGDYEYWKGVIKKESKDGKNYTFDKTTYTLNDNGTISYIGKKYADGLTVTKYDQDRNFNYIEDCPNKEFMNNHNKHLIECVKEYAKNYEKVDMSYTTDNLMRLHTCLITKETIILTKFLVDSKVDMCFYNKWSQDFDMLLKLLKDNIILALEVAQSGNGMDFDTIYRTDYEKYVFDGIKNIKFLDSDYEY